LALIEKHLPVNIDDDTPIDPPSGERIIVSATLKAMILGVTSMILHENFSHHAKEDTRTISRFNLPFCGTNNFLVEKDIVELLLHMVSQTIDCQTTASNTDLKSWSDLIEGLYDPSKKLVVPYFNWSVPIENLGARCTFMACNPKTLSRYEKTLAFLGYIKGSKLHKTATTKFRICFPFKSSIAQPLSPKLLLERIKFEMNTPLYHQSILYIAKNEEQLEAFNKYQMVKPDPFASMEDNTKVADTNMFESTTLLFDKIPSNPNSTQQPVLSMDLFQQLLSGNSNSTFNLDFMNDVKDRMAKQLVDQFQSSKVVIPATQQNNSSPYYTPSQTPIASTQNSQNSQQTTIPHTQISQNSPSTPFVNLHTQITSTPSALSNNEMDVDVSQASLLEHSQY